MAACAGSKKMSILPAVLKNLRVLRHITHFELSRFTGLSKESYFSIFRTKAVYKNHWCRPYVLGASILNLPRWYFEWVRRRNIIQLLHHFLQQKLISRKDTVRLWLFDAEDGGTSFSETFGNSLSFHMAWYSGRLCALWKIKVVIWKIS